LYSFNKKLSPLFLNFVHHTNLYNCSNETPRWITMKIWPLLIGIIVILAIVSSPVLAISKSDLISYYKGQSAPSQDKPNNSDTFSPIIVWPTTPTPTPLLPSWFVPSPLPWKNDSPSVKPTIIPTTTPTQSPLGTGTGTLLVTSTPTGAPVYLDGVYKGITPVTITEVSYGLHRIKVTLDGNIDQSIYVKVTNNWAIVTVHVTQQGAEVGVSILERKPVIYLYSDRDLTAQVRLEPEQAITVSEPVYQPGKGWWAEIRNGSLNGKGDFLFYEALVPDSVWQKNEGYVIRAAYREQDMTFMLGQYGFNEKETADFIDYWANHLTGVVDYVFYPQETDAVDRAMPLYISPEPDEVNRIWFYAEPLVSAPEPVAYPEKIVRGGFHVVEWGVMIRDE
jgi:hypothetical protein